MLQLDGSEQRELFPTGKQPEPLVCALQGDKFALGRDDQTVLIDIDGNPSAKCTLVTWSETPMFLGNYSIQSIQSIHTAKCRDLTLDLISGGFTVHGGRATVVR